ncbi:MAG: hypothetical protein ACI971_002412, partial [Colwellia sp.]
VNFYRHGQLYVNGQIADHLKVNNKQKKAP